MVHLLHLQYKKSVLYFVKIRDSTKENLPHNYFMILCTLQDTENPETEDIQRLEDTKNSNVANKDIKYYGT